MNIRPISIKILANSYYRSSPWYDDSYFKDEPMTRSRSIGTMLSALALLLSGAASTVHADPLVLFRATPKVYEAVIPSSKVSLSPSSATVSITDGNSSSSRTMFTISNSGGAATDPLTWSVYDQETMSGTLSNAGHFASSAGTCVAASPLAAGASCTVYASRTATGNDPTVRTQYLHVLHGGSSKLVATLSGTASGYPDCATPGDKCLDGTVFLGAWGKNYYARVGSFETVTWANRLLCPAGYAVPSTYMVSQTPLAIQAALAPLGLSTSWVHDQYNASRGWYIVGSSMSDMAKTSLLQVMCITS
jgi:hypothetical protein